MQISDGKIGYKELFSSILFLIAIKATDSTPDLLFYHGMNAAWLIALLSALIMAVPLKILVRLMNKYNTGLYDLIRTFMGRWIGELLVIVLLIFLFASTSLNARSYIDIVNTLFFPQTNIPNLLFLLMLFSSLVAIRGFETLGRMCWFLFGVIQVVGIFLFVTTWQHTYFTHLFPILGPGLKGLLWNALVHSSIYGEIILLAFMYPYVRSSFAYRKGVWIGFILASVFLIFFHGLYVLVFDYPPVLHVAFPYHQLTRAASFGTQAAHFEAIFLGIWIISAVIHFAFYLYLLAYLFARTFKIHEFEPLIYPLAMLIFLFGGFPKNIVQQTVLRDLLINSSSFLFILLPVVLWALQRWKGRST